MLHHCFGITRFLIDFVALRSKCPQLSSIKQVDEIGNNLRLYRTTNTKRDHKYNSFMSVSYPVLSVIRFKGAGRSPRYIFIIYCF